MKKILTILILIVASINSISQDVVGSRVIAKQAFFLRDTWVDSLKKGILNWQNDFRTVPTSGAVYDFVAANGGSATINNTVYVSKNGNDATGLRNRLDKPFLTIWAAKAVALTGDAIVVFPGTYNEIHPLLLNNNITYNFVGSGEVTLTTVLTTGSIFKDSSTSSTNFIFAPGWDFTARLNQHVVNLTIPDSRLTFTFNEVTSVGRETIVSDDDTWIKLVGHRLFSTTAQVGLYLREDTSYVDIDIIESDEGNAVNLDYPYYTIIHSKQIVTNDNISGNFALVFFGSDSSSKIYIRSDVIKAGTGWSVYGYGDSQDAYVEAQLITDSSDCVVVGSGNMNLRVRADVIETRTAGTIDGIIHKENGGGGVLTVEGARVLRPNSTSGPDVRSFGGTIYLNSVVYDRTKVTALNGAVIRRIDSVFKSSIVVDGVIGGLQTTLTESSATTFLTTTLTSGSVQGGEVIVTIQANDATNYQARTLRFTWSAVNKSGTLTITISTPDEVVALSSGTLTCTITAVDGGSGVLQFKANAVSSLTQTTLQAGALLNRSF